MAKLAWLLPLTLVGLLASARYLVVDVKEDGHRIVVPVPLALAGVGLRLAPAEATRLSCPDWAPYREATARLLEALADAPAGELLRFEDETETVVIGKTDDGLEISVLGSDEIVSASIPLEAARDLLSRYDGEGLEASDVLAALGSVARSDLLHVRTSDQEVKIWLW